jgi:hypothetical protein
MVVSNEIGEYFVALISYAVQGLYTVPHCLAWSTWFQIIHDLSARGAEVSLSVITFLQGWVI